MRRRWVERLLDHDGRGDHAGANAGGIEAWTRLGQAVGLAREDLSSCRHVLPGVRFAVDAYVNFARQAPWQEAAISSLTELFAPKIHADRLAGWPTHYPWIEPQGLHYFRSRITLAERDVEHGLEIARGWCDSRERQERALQILQFKLDILWAMLDAIERAYPDDLPELPDNADVYVQPGQLWLLGEHRVLCGDATNADDVARRRGEQEAGRGLTAEEEHQRLAEVRDGERASRPEGAQCEREREQELQRRRQSGQRSRLLQLLRAHSLIARLPHTRRYRVTDRGFAFMSAAIHLRHKAFPADLKDVPPTSAGSDALIARLGQDAPLALEGILSSISAGKAVSPCSRAGRPAKCSSQSMRTPAASRTRLTAGTWSSPTPPPWISVTRRLTLPSRNDE